MTGDSSVFSVHNFELQKSYLYNKSKRINKNNKFNMILL